MPNYCDYELKIVGDKKENVDKMIQYLQQGYNYGDEEYMRNTVCGKHFFRVFDACVAEEKDESHEGELNVAVEIFSEECGMGFMEHYIVDKGEITVESCVDYSEGYDEETDEYHPEGGLEWNYTI